MVTLVGVSRLAPMLLLGMVAGSLADRFSKILLMRGFQLVNLAIAAVLTFLVFIDAIEAWHIFPAMFITGVAWTVDFSSRRSFYSDLFTDSRVVNAIALDSAAATGCNMLGPILAGAMIDFTGYQGAFLFMCAASTVGFLFLSTVKAPYSRTAERRSVGVAEQVVESLKAVRSNQTLWAVVIVTICLNFFGFPFMQMVPVIAKETLNVGELGFGILLAAVWNRLPVWDPSHRFKGSQKARRRVRSGGHANAYRGIGFRHFNRLYIVLLLAADSGNRNGGVRQHAIVDYSTGRRA